MAFVYKVGPKVSDRTHHMLLTTRTQKSVGIILCNDRGEVLPRFALQPVERTAFRTTSGTSSYGDLEYPYSNIVQDDWSGGRGNLDFERDATKFYDSYRMRTGRANKAFHGPQEQFCTGIRSLVQSVPGNVTFHKLIGTQRQIARRFLWDSVSGTITLSWLLVKRAGKPEDLRIALYSDSAGSINAELSHIDVANTRLADILSEWLNEVCSQAVVNGTNYWIIVTADASDSESDHWEVGIKAGSPVAYYSENGGAMGNWTLSTFDLYFRLNNVSGDKLMIPFEYKEQQYVVISTLGNSILPKLFINGDRGAADSNAGQLTKLIDATKAWTINEWAGCVCLITDGPGKEEYKVVVSNTATELVFADSFITTHTTSTEYVILGSNKWTEIGIGGYGGTHGLTVPVTAVLVSTTGVIYFCQGDAVNIRRHREYNNAGTWTSSDWADDGTNKATFMVFKPLEQRILIGNNATSAGVAAVQTAKATAAPPAWGTDITFSAAVAVGSPYRRMNGMDVYPDDSGNEAVRVYKIDIPWIVPGSGNPYPINLREMEHMRSQKNGAAHLVHNVYEYFSLGNGLERYYGGQVDDLGPNLGEGLPTDRQGPIVALQGYPGKFFALIDGGASGYSSVMARDNNGWHEHYRAPKGQRLNNAAFQPIPGTTLDRLWLCQGNELIWLPFPSDGTNELHDSNYKYTHEANLVLSRMHAGMFDVMKLVKILKLQTENLEKDVCWIQLDYRLNEDSDWTVIEELFTTSPTQELDLVEQFGLNFRRMQIRIRSFTANASLTPILLAFIAEAVIQVSVKNQVPLTFRLMDHEPTLTDGVRMPDPYTAEEKWEILEEAVGDFVHVRSEDWMVDDLVMFLNPIQYEKVKVEPPEAKGDPQRHQPYEVHVCTTSLQEA